MPGTIVQTRLNLLELVKLKLFASENNLTTFQVIKHLIQELPEPYTYNLDNYKVTRKDVITFAKKNKIKLSQSFLEALNNLGEKEFQRHWKHAKESTVTGIPISDEKLLKDWLLIDKYK